VNCKLFLIPVIVFAPLVGGCASASAKAPAEQPALNVPPPPPRVIEPVPLPEPQPEVVSELPPVAPAPSKPPKPATPKPQSSAEPKVDPKAGDSKPVEPPPAEPAPPTTPPAQLRTPQTADTTGAAKAVRATIDNARGILNTVNFGPLSNERKKAYNDAKLFLDQADTALKEGNLAFAQGVAVKAETLAKELAGR
jgi:outer membrane biosynthesis protein TonB